MNNKLPSVEEKPKGRISAIWILPIMAACIGAWLIYSSFRDAPILIDIEFDSGDGIEIGKTVIRYEGIDIGTVTNVRVQPDLTGVITSVEVDRRAENALKDNTQFWIVRPEVSLSGVRGLGTVLSGIYIAAKIGDGEPTRYFKGLSSAPPKSTDDPGLLVVLKAQNLGSINLGSPVIYKKITIGSVQTYDLDANGEGVTINVFIEPEYSHLIKASSRFWNASGISIKGGLTGFDIRTDSLTSVLVGGIGLSTLADNMQAPAVESGSEFTLYDDFAEGEVGALVDVKFPFEAGIESGITQVIYRGMVVGRVQSVEVNQDLNSLDASLELIPRVEEYLNKNTRIWIRKPDISLSNLASVGSLLAGKEIEIDFDGQAPDSTRNFVALEKAPILMRGAPGLHLTLTVDSLKSVSRGMDILYRSVPVGSVIDYRLSKNQKMIELDAHIKPEYAHLVNSSSRFWNDSGVHIRGGLDGISLRTSSLTSILLGGISFFTPDAKAPKVKNKKNFRLYTDYDSAHSLGVPITLAFADGEGLKKDSKIKFEGIEVGTVTSVSLNETLDGVIVRASLNEGAEEVAKEGTQFWLVKPELGLVKSANLDALFAGRYITFKPGKGRAAYNFKALEAPPLIDKVSRGLNLVLTSDQLNSVKQGVAVSYRGVVVGSVTGHSLAANADHVRIFINIEERYAPLIRKNTKFWNASGLDIGLKLFGGATIKTESVESVLEGGISLATPNEGDMGARAGEGAVFELLPERKDHWLNWSPRIKLNESGGS